jgi:monoamine oxidase
VLGGGLAGLSAAYNLRNEGYEVTVLEAQGTVGGRVKTLREPFQDDGYAELGAIRVPDAHAFTNKYVSLFGLKLGEYDEPDNRLFYLDGKRFTKPTGEWPIAGLTPEERQDPFAALGTYFGKLFEKVGNQFAEGWPLVESLTSELDPLTLRQFLTSIGASDAWCRFFVAAEGNLHRLGALPTGALESADPDWRKTFGIRGGNDQLPKAFARALGDAVKLNSQVLRLKHDADRVVVTFRDRDGTHQIEADHCVAAIPLSVFRKIILEPAFADSEKMAAIDTMKYMAAARCYFQTKTRFWQNDPLGRLTGLKLIGTDTAAERVWNMSTLQPHPTRGLLQCYLFDTNAEAFSAIAPEQRVQRMKAVVETFLPGLRDEVVATAYKCWHEDPHQQGAWGWIQPGEYRWMWPACRRAAGRVHFAGEHTSIWIAWMNGALESGERAAREIMASAGT